MLLTDSIGTLKNVGAERLAIFHKLNIYTVKDLIEYYPRDYEDRSKIKKIEELIVNEINVIKIKIFSTGENLKIRGLNITKIKVKDDTGTLDIIWYNQPYLKNYFKKGEEFIFIGKLNLKYGKLQLESPDYEKISDKELLSSGRIVPIYSLVYKLSQKMLRGFIYSALENTKEEIKETLPSWILEKYNLCDKSFAVHNIHFPQNDESFFIARKRLVFEELFLVQIYLLQTKSYFKNKKTNIILKDLDFSKLLRTFTFSLTQAQTNVLEDIKNDLKNNFLINRLIQGDVGSGKTAIAAIAAFIAINNGYQVALMAPTEVLAVQHFKYFHNLFSDFSIKSVLLSSSLRKKEKDNALNDIKIGQAKMIVGTHAVIQKKVEFINLGLVITDEQHRFGVRQRIDLSEKGQNPHVLIMTATPIPRTLGLILYGDLDISIIDELPPGRQKIDTYCVNGSYRERIYKFILKEISHGRQAYIICPLIEENETLELKSVIKYTDDLKENFFKNLNIECLHGKMKWEIKNEIMNRFLNQETKILISTTVIEVGINVPNATVMFIENAERFGLAQLHQLRGRVGRGIYKSYCILMSDSKTKTTKKRLDVLAKNQDGFEVSRLDLELRGAGDFFGTRQHGIPQFKIANLYKDLEILKIAQEAAAQVFNNDPEFLLEQNAFLKIEKAEIISSI